MEMDYINCLYGMELDFCVEKEARIKFKECRASLLNTYAPPFIDKLRTFGIFQDDSRHRMQKNEVVYNKSVNSRILMKQ